MDITTNELKSMKAKQLRRMVREAIQQVLAEDQAADKKAQDSAKQAETAKLQALQKKKLINSKTILIQKLKLEILFLILVKNKCGFKTWMNLKKHI